MHDRPCVRYLPYPIVRRAQGVSEYIRRATVLSLKCSNATVIRPYRWGRRPRILSRPGRLDRCVCMCNPLIKRPSETRCVLSSYYRTISLPFNAWPASYIAHTPIRKYLPRCAGANNFDHENKFYSEICNTRRASRPSKLPQNRPGTKIFAVRWPR